MPYFPRRADQWQVELSVVDPESSLVAAQVAGCVPLEIYVPLGGSGRAVVVYKVANAIYIEVVYPFVHVVRR